MSKEEELLNAFEDHEFVSSDGLITAKFHNERYPAMAARTRKATGIVGNNWFIVHYLVKQDVGDKYVLKVTIEGTPHYIQFSEGSERADIQEYFDSIFLLPPMKLILTREGGEKIGEYSTIEQAEIAIQDDLSSIPNYDYNEETVHGSTFMKGNGIDRLYMTHVFLKDGGTTSIDHRLISEE